MIQQDIDALAGERTNDTRKHSILNILNNVGSIFTGLYFRYKDVSKETGFERNIRRENKIKERKF